jgi:hypothetical protein
MVWGTVPYPTPSCSSFNQPLSSEARNYGCAACRIRVLNGACGWWCIPPRRGQGTQASSQERAEQSFRDDGEESMLGRRQWQNALHLHRTWPWCGRAPTIAHGNPVD